MYFSPHTLSITFVIQSLILCLSGTKTSSHQASMKRVFQLGLRLPKYYRSLSTPIIFTGAH